MAAQSYGLALPLLAEADAEARALGHAWIAPEHLLLAVAGAGQGASREFFSQHELTPDTLRASIVTVLGSAAATRLEGPLTIALRSHVALAQAITAGRRRGGPGPYTPDDLLLALLSDDVARGAVVGAVLERAGMTPDAARTEVAALRDDGGAA